MDSIAGWLQTSARYKMSTIEPSKFNAIFGMFVTITAFGTFCTGLLALDAYRLMKQGIDIKPRKGGH
jgi:hypothetical protein